MTVAHPLKLWSEEEYFEFDELSPLKHEFWHGRVLVRAEATPRHVIVAGRIVTALSTCLSETLYEVGTSDLKVNAGEGIYVFPDVVVWSEDARWDERHSHVLLTPCVLAEILSPSTQSMDRGAKLAAYQTLTSLLDYLIVWPDMVQIEHYARQNETDWRFRRYLNRNQTIEFAALDLQITVAEFYRRLDVPEGVITLDLPFDDE